MKVSELIKRLESIVGSKQLLSRHTKTAYYRSGFHSGKGTAAAVVFPTTLLQQWQVLEVCVEANGAIIMQAAKTGLTEGSCPSGEDYERPVVVINTTRLKGIHLLAGGKQALAFPGATLHELESYNADPRRLHEVSGSAGKVAGFAVRVDTYPQPKKTQVFYLGAKDPNPLPPDP